MFKKKDPERLVLVSGGRNTYNTAGSVPNQEALQIDGAGGIKHCHDNSHAQEDREREKKVARKRLYVVSVICMIFMIGEILGGYFAGSLAVMTDAAHLLVDFTSFIISLLSLWLSSRPATHKLNYGWHRAEILGALLSVFTIWLVTGVLVYLAVERLISDDYTIEGTVMLITSGCAVLANIIMALVLHQSGHGHSHGGLSSHGHSHGGLSPNDKSHEGLSSNGHSNGGLRSSDHSHKGLSLNGHSNGGLNPNGHSNEGLNPNGHSHEGLNSNGHSNEDLTSNGHSSGGLNSNGHSHGGLNSNGHSHGGLNSNGHSNGDLSSNGHSSGGLNSNGHSHGGLNSNGHSHGGLNSNGHSNGDLSSNDQGHSHKKEEEHNQISNHAHSNDDLNVDLEQNSSAHGRRAQQANASVRAAFVHVVGDFFQSISVFISAIIIFFKPEYKMADPICTFLFSIFVLCTTITIMRDILIVLMEGTPAGVRYSEVRDGLLAVKGVTAVHNLHIWALTMNQAVLSAHIAIDDSVDAQTVLREMTQACFSSYNFHSVTIQMERQADLKPGCILCEDPKM
ncbi:Zinc transporter 8 [Larimichthys crocea]|uniref:Proton-coupled zinc antiporter SLC30A8 n=1 Tax=Larimichthys crocea TaxID=215358 RepID=A0A6G0HRL7_LARCR|nr:Zinc transporter 8 [Larimichthys crocea]